MDLPPPSTLTQLPRPLQSSNGKTQIGEVSSLVESRKRKRYEVAVAVDGEGLNIYNVRTTFFPSIFHLLNYYLRSNIPSLSRLMLFPRNPNFPAVHFLFD